MCIIDFILGSLTPPLPLELLLHPQFPLPSSLFYSIHSGNRFSFFSLENPPLTLSHPCQDSWLQIQFLPPSLFSLSASHTGGGYANSTLSFLNWLIEARMLWRPCLCAALSLSLPLSCSLSHTQPAFLFCLHREDASSEEKPVSDLVQQKHHCIMIVVDVRTTNHVHQVFPKNKTYESTLNNTVKYVITCILPWISLFQKYDLLNWHKQESCNFF